MGFDISAFGINKNDLPLGWKTDHFDTIVSFNPEQISRDYPHFNIAYLDIANVSSGTTKPPEIMALLNAPSRAKRIVRQFDSILSTVRPGNRAYAFFQEVPENFVVSTGFVVLRAKRDIADPRFIYYLATSDPIINYLSSIAEEKTAYPSVNPDDIGECSIPIPPISEQRAIAHILGTLDDKIELNRRMNETLEAMARAIFKSWFVDFDPVRAKAEGRDTGLPKHIADLFPARFVDSELGEIPEGWEVKTIGDIVERISVGKKYEQKTVAAMGTVPVLDQGKSGVIGYHNDEPGIVASIDRPVAVFANHTCYMRLVHFSFSAIQNVLPFIGKGVDTFWVFFATYGKQPFIEYKGHWPDFIIHKIVVPEPTYTVLFAELVRPLLKKMWANGNETITLVSLRDELLPKLISGELRVLYTQHLQKTQA